MIGFSNVRRMLIVPVFFSPGPLFLIALDSIEKVGYGFIINGLRHYLALDSQLQN